MGVGTHSCRRPSQRRRTGNIGAGDGNVGAADGVGAGLVSELDWSRTRDGLDATPRDIETPGWIGTLSHRCFDRTYPR